MKISALLRDPDGGSRGIQQLALRWGAALAGRSITEEDDAKSRTVAFMLDSNSLWRIDGNLRGVRIECRSGRLWITQEGEPADVILESGQRFVARNGGALVVQSVPSSAKTAESSGAFKEIAFGVASRATIRPLRISRKDKATIQSRLRVGLIETDPTLLWERLAYAILWGCGLVGVAHCFGTLVWLL